ncbi:MAG TPA: hypothetical protein DCQ29_03095 [Chitinophagaceae bacterium]|nr:hypothetical protein [Chitinophagaceae bacterium]
MNEIATMIHRITTAIALLLLGLHVQAQTSYPNFDSSALVLPTATQTIGSKPYTVIVYGGVGCGYSQFLIQKLDVLNDCAALCDIVLIMDQPKDSVLKHMATTAALYPTYTNTLLQYQLRKKRDIFPQLLVFKNRVLIDHYIGIKEGMLSKTKERILNGR